MLRVVYGGSPQVAATILELLLRDSEMSKATPDEQYEIVGVLTNPPTAKGRHSALVPTEVEQYARMWNAARGTDIKVLSPEHVCAPEREELAKLNPDIFICFAYGHILGPKFFSLFKYGGINIHPSILPKYRGAAPIQRAIMNGETYTGVTLMEMVDKMDAGKMYGVVSCEISPDDNYTSLCEKIVKCAIEVTKKFLPVYLEGKLLGEEQDESKVTFADKILPETEKLSLDYDAKTFVNYVRGMSEEPGGYLMLNELKFKILKAKIVDQKIDGSVGSLLINKSVYLKLKDAVVELLEVQLAGKKKMDGRSFANGSKHLNSIILK